MASNIYLKELRIVLLGKTGVGKSSLGNSLLQEKVFKSSACGSSVTYECKMGSRKLADGNNLILVDTPGLFDTRRSNDKTALEICRCVGLSSPGPHVFIFVLRIGRFTEEELETITHLQNIFGKHVMKHVMVVFTEKDSLEDDEKTLQQYVAEAPANLKNVLSQCGSRFVAVNNRLKGSALKAEMESVMEVVKQTIADNGGHYYTGEMYAAAERAMKEKIQKIQEEKDKEERELQRRKDELERKEKEHNTNMDKQIKDLEKRLADVKARDARQEVRQKVESSDGIGMTILKTIGNIALTAVTAVVASRCSIM